MSTQYHTNVVETVHQTGDRITEVDYVYHDIRNGNVRKYHVTKTTRIRTISSFNEQKNTTI